MSSDTMATDVNPAYQASRGDLASATETALWIRAFERELLSLFQQGLLAGTVHTCVGQEWCAAALHPHLRPGVDAFFATHRGHGHYLAHGGPPGDFLAELMGRDGALCLGRGGTQNLHYERFFSAGIQGGSAPISVGFAWAARHRGEDSIAVAQIGDGTLGEGTFYEALNFAGWLNTPTLFLLEANGWAQSTDVARTSPGNIVERATGFGIKVNRISDEDPDSLFDFFAKIVDQVRQGEPHLVVVDTRRLMAHSKGDDDRPQELVQRLWAEDPLTRLIERSSAAKAFADRATAEIEALADEVARRPVLTIDNQIEALPPSSRIVSSRRLHSDWVGGSSAGQSVRRIAEDLNEALHEMMSNNGEIVLIGEDLLDPYGGAFKVSKGLSTRFPERVLSTPIAEAAIVGAANGMALAGMRPIAEIMFGDFATLTVDQMVNFAAKFYFMYAGRVTCPLTLRLVSGGGRGYGPTHSQSLETLFCGIPGLRVVALSRRHRPGQLLTEVVLHDDAPVVFVENKQMYAQRPHLVPPLDLRPVQVDGHDGNLPPLKYEPHGSAEAGVTLVTYGGMTGAAEAAMGELIESEELAFDYIVLTQLWPLDSTEIVESVARTGKLVVVEEHVADYGVSAAVIAAVAQRLPTGFASRAVGSMRTPIPSVRHLEDAVLPSARAISAAIMAIQ